MNLHKIVRAAITRVNPDEENTLTQSTGVLNTDGIITNLTSATVVKAQWQPVTNPLEHTDGIDVTKIEMKVYLFSDDALPVAGIRRLPEMRAGDMLTRADGTVWLITSVLENWSPDGWAAVTATMQEEETIEETPVVYYLFTIPETVHQSIIVTCGGKEYTSTFAAAEGDTWEATVTADTGYTAGVLSESGGTISGAVNLAVTNAVLTSILHTFDAETGNQKWTWTKDVEAGANGPTVLDVDAATEYTITGNGVSGALGYRYLSYTTYFVIEDFYTGTTAADWGSSGAIYKYLYSHALKVYPLGSPDNYLFFKKGTAPPQATSKNGAWTLSSANAAAADGKTVSELREIINDAFKAGEGIVYEICDEP